MQQDLEQIVNFTQKNELKEVVDKIVHEAVNSKSNWSEDDIANLSAEVPQKAVEELYKKNKNFKYCAVCTITKKTQSSLHINSACMWNAARDSFLTSQAENPIFFCILNVFAVGIQILVNQLDKKPKI